MKNVVRTVVGLAMVAAAVLLGAWALYEVIRIGTCASGGPYVSARECPPGTGTKVFALTGSVFLVIIGGFITPGAAIGGVAWALGFILLGAAFFVGTFGPAAPQMTSEVKYVGVGVGGMFIVMGLPGLLMMLRAGRGSRGRFAVDPWGGKAVRPSKPAPPAQSVPGRDAELADLDDLVARYRSQDADAGGNVVAELEKLAALKATGVLTEAEFQQAKAKILGHD